MIILIELFMNGLVAAEMSSPCPYDLDQRGTYSMAADRTTRIKTEILHFVT